VLEALEFSTCSLSGGACTTDLRQISAPEPRSKHISNLDSVSETNPEVNKRSPITMGEACPVGHDTFHFTFSLLSQRVGNPFSMLVPSPRGPRHPAQSEAAEGVTAKTITLDTTKQRTRKGERICEGFITESFKMKPTFYTRLFFLISAGKAIVPIISRAKQEKSGKDPASTGFSSAKWTRIP